MSVNRRFGRKSLLGLAVLVPLAAGTYTVVHYPLDRVETYDDPEEHFKYGSIGADVENGLPLEVMTVLPRAFPEHMPPGPKDYTAFGFVQEPGRDMPIGFSVREKIFPRTGMNCSTCHVGRWRASVDAEPRVIMGMPAAELDIGAYFDFLFKVVADERFTGDYLIPVMQENGAELSLTDELLYDRVVIPRMKERLLQRKEAFAQLFEGPAFGPGRVDTFNPYKLNQLAEHYPDGIPHEESIGTVDYPAIWNQGIRVDMALNWDGNSPTIHDRNVGAAFGAGATRESIDMGSINRITGYLSELPPPAYPWGVTDDAEVLAEGERLFEAQCASCHAEDGAYVGEVVPLERIGTDPWRVNSYTDELNRELLDYGEGYDWKLRSMVNTDGYANQPLDGIWARAPYLHNGSVPTLAALLEPDDQRPRTFWIGHGVFDTVGVGIRTDVKEGWAGRDVFLFDTSIDGNSNAGHSGPGFGTDLTDEQKRALLEYMKTL